MAASQQPDEQGTCQKDEVYFRP